MKRYLDEQFNYNTKEWSMQSYGQRYFDIPKDYEGSIEALIEEMIRYSKLPIKQSHTKLPPQEKYQKLAVECFEAILKVQDPLIKSMATVYPHMQKIITIGLENPEMRDEILFQLSKQVFMPMDEVPVGWDIILHNGWLLIVLATAAFRPSKAFVKYFQAFLLNTADQYKFAPDITIKKFALQSEENLKNSAMNGIRKFPPSIKEIRAIEVRSGAANEYFKVATEISHS